MKLEHEPYPFPEIELTLLAPTTYITLDVLPVPALHLGPEIVPQHPVPTLAMQQEFVPVIESILHQDYFDTFRRLILHQGFRSSSLRLETPGM